MTKKRLSFWNPILILVIFITVSLVLSAGCSIDSKLPTDLYVYKTDSSGNVLWKTKINEGPDEFANIIIETPQKDLVVGTRYRFVARMNLSGEVNKTPAPDDRTILTSLATHDGGKLMFGGNVTKLDSNGTMEWETQFNDVTKAIQLKNGYYIIDYLNPSPAYMRVVCLATNGSILWENDPEVEAGNKISSLYESPDHVIEITSENNVKDSGEKYPYLTESKQVNLDVEGNFLAKKSINATGPITRTDQGQYVFAAFSLQDGKGFSRYSPDTALTHIVKLATDGTLIWDKSLTTTGGNHPLSIIQTSDGGYAVLLLVEK
jgi:hypothetical protein